MVRILAIVLLLVGIAGIVGGSTDSKPRVIVVPIDGVVDLGMAPFVERAVRDATTMEVDAVVLDINTLGGRIDAALLIRDALVDSPVPTLAYIHPRAISAGALISLSCEKIAMAPGASIGSATPVVGNAAEMEAADEKTVSYFRAEMRATAERRGRPADVAEAMVDREVEIDDLIEKGKLLTLTTSDAIRLGIADFEAESLEAALEQIELGSAEQITHSINWAEQFARWVSHPMLSSLLMSLGMLGIMLELYRPGWGIPGTVGVVCLALFFLGHFVVHLAGWEEVLLFAVGAGLLAVELLVIPGFGVAGVAGIGAMLAALFLSLIGRDLNLSWQLGHMTDALVVMAGGMIGMLAGGVLMVRLIPGTAGNLFILRRNLDSGDGVVSHRRSDQDRFPPGTEGQALGDLRPAGVIRIGSDRLDAVSEGSFVPRGSTVVIVSWRTGQPVVRLAQPADATGAKAEDES